VDEFHHVSASSDNRLGEQVPQFIDRYKSSRRITTPDHGPLFSHQEADDNLPSGYIYILRSQSAHPFIADNRSVIHKIDVTGDEVERDQLESDRREIVDSELEVEEMR
jgi:hypothetical protein